MVVLWLGFILVIEHGIVFLLCTHGVNLGRTKLHEIGDRVKKTGQLAELLHM